MGRAARRRSPISSAERSQLIVYHFMFGPEWKEGCPSCSFLADTFDGAVVHLAQRDVSFVAISRATLPQIEAFKKRMGWQFKWVSSFGNEFNYDYHVSFSKDEQAQGKVYYNYDMNEFPSEEGPGASVFYKNEAGEIFHTYSSFARGLDPMIGTYNWLDLTPNGRDEEGLAHAHGVGAASRQVWRWTGGRPEEAVRSAGESRRLVLFGEGTRLSKLHPQVAPAFSSKDKDVGPRAGSLGSQKTKPTPAVIMLLFQL